MISDTPLRSNGSIMNPESDISAGPLINAGIGPRLTRGLSYLEGGMGRRKGGGVRESQQNDCGSN